MTRVLFLTQFFSPEPAHIVHELAHSLVEAGLEVTVLTGYPNYPYGKIYEGYRGKFISRERIGKLDVIRLPLYPAHGKSGLKRALNFISFAISVTVLGPWLIPRVDVIHVYQLVTLGWPARCLAWLKGASVTFEVQDLWPETLASTGMLQRPAMLKWIGRFSDHVYRSMDRIRVISDGFRSKLIERGVPDDRIHRIGSWVDTELYRPQEYDAELANAEGLGERFNIVFAGAIGLAQDLRTAVHAAATLHDLPQVQFVFIGDGSELESLKSLVETLKLSNVKFLGRRPVEQMPTLYGLADVLLLQLRDDPLFGITIPYKLYAYLASGKPILAAVSGEAAALVERHRAGVSCAPGNAEGLAAGVRKFVSMSPGERQLMGKRARDAAVEHYSRPLLTRQVAAMIEQSARERLSSVDRRRLFVKRIFDVVTASILLIVLAPLLLILALAIRLSLGSPILFRQRRPGKRGQLFTIYKFRTMRDPTLPSPSIADLAKANSPHSDAARLTRFGAWLRGTSLDELPELFNVLRGEMSLVGPRPLLVEYLQRYSLEQARRHEVTPGITGWAQVNGRNAIDWEQKFALDVWYVDHQSLRLDLKILVMTLWKVVTRDGISAPQHATMPPFLGERNCTKNSR
jgi:lipopolysaccharide/colanic/teichoic acid biosynthesis glycosyltransferase